MTELRDINSTRQTSKDVNGNTIIMVHDSLLAEIMLSVIMGITLLSLMVVVRSYIDIIDVSLPLQFVPLIMSVIHVLIRRTTIRSQLLIFIIHAAADIAFFLTVIKIPALQYGNNIANMIYLAAILTVFTLFSLFYRLRPTFTAADAEFIVFPAIIHVVLYLLYVIAHHERYSRIIVIHAILIAVIFVIMRQKAVFDSKYYHSMRKSSKPIALLRKQNNRTIAILLGIIAISLLVLTVFPTEWITNIIITVLKAVFGLIFFLITLLHRESDETVEIEDPLDKMEIPPETGEFNPFLDILGKVLALLILIAIMVIIFRLIHTLILNAPKYKKKTEVNDSGALTDTIEDISPEKRSFTVKGQDFGTGYERRIRKQFYTKARRAMHKGLPVSDSSTPGQIESILLSSGDREISGLRQEYEKVRYGKK